MVCSVCLKPVPMVTWQFHTLWRFTVPAYVQSTFSIVCACVATQFQNASFKFIWFWYILLLLWEKHGVFLLICLFLLTKVFTKFKWILFDKKIGPGSFRNLCRYFFQFLFTEAKYAYNKDVPIIPVKVSADFEPRGWLGALVGTSLYYVVDSEETLQKNFPNLLRAIKKIKCKAVAAPPVTQPPIKPGKDMYIFICLQV